MGLDIPMLLGTYNEIRFAPVVAMKDFTEKISELPSRAEICRQRKRLQIMQKKVLAIILPASYNNIIRRKMPDKHRLD